MDLIGSPDAPRSPATSEASASTFRSPTGSEAMSGPFRSPSGSDVAPGTFRSPAGSDASLRSPSGSYGRSSSRSDVSSTRADVSNGSTFRLGNGSAEGGRRRSSNGGGAPTYRIRRTSSSNSRGGDGKPAIHTLPDGSADERVKVYVRVRPMAFQGVEGDEDGVAIRADQDKKQVGGVNCATWGRWPGAQCLAFRLFTPKSSAWPELC